MYKYPLKITFCIAIFFAAVFTSRAQRNNLPQEYFKLNTDTAKMRFLMKAISDSLDADQLTHIMDWSGIGLAMAGKNNVDTMKGIFYFDIAKAFTYKYAKFDSAIFYYKKVLSYFPDKARKYNTFSTREIMERYADLGNKDSSFLYMDMLIAYIDTMADNNPKKVTLSQNIATTYQWFGLYKTAIRYFQVAINGDRQNKNFRGLGLALANLGELYNSLDDREKAIQYAKEGLGYLADVNMPYMQTAANITDYYIGEQNDSARFYLRKSDSVNAKLSDQNQQNTNQLLLARILTTEKKYGEAKNIFIKAQAYLSKNDDTWSLCRTLLYFSNLDTSMQQYNDAKKHLLDMLTISRKNEFTIFSIIALQNLAYAHSKTGDYKNAFKYQQEYIQLKDSVSNDKAKANLNDLEISYKTLQKEQEIALLKKDNDIKSLQIKDSARLKLFYLALLIFLIALFGLIYYQRNRRNKIETEKIKAELQTQVLRSQMNPHFIFNCLNSIENFIMQNDKRSASDYLNKFSLLIRSILDSSRNEVVPIVKDMEALKLYVELEQLRFNNKFSFKVYVDPALAGGDYLVPSLLIQPFVENAIVHGMAHSEGKNLNLIVIASLEGDKIKYVIQDNGIGREKAKVYNMQNKPYHKSVGLKITEERINIFNDHEKKESINIVDLYDENKNADGTKVEITLKAI